MRQINAILSHIMNAEIQTLTTVSQTHRASMNASFSNIVTVAVLKELVPMIAAILNHILNAGVQICITAVFNIRASMNASLSAETVAVLRQ